MARKAIPKGVRFDVFERDKFTCQYCGAKAPDVVLEIDHIIPVSKGGDNTITNLVTACEDCNRGKSAKVLNENAAMNKKRAELDRLAERREQLEAMYKWELSLVGVRNEQARRVADLFETLTGYEVDDGGLDSIAKWVRKYGTGAVMRGVRISVQNYFDPHSGTHTRAEYTFGQVPKIVYNLTHKTCKQCVNAAGYSWDTRMTKCSRDPDGGYTHENKEAEICEFYESRFRDDEVAQ